MKMKRILFILLVTILYASTTFALNNNSKIKNLDAMIAAGMKDWQVPGLAAVVVKDGKVVFKKVYGIKDIDTKEPIDEDTLFSMASTTKALIAISLGILVDQGKINWDDKVIDHFASFKLTDPNITANARVKDLLTHNLGIGNADLLWVMDDLTSAEIIHKFQYAEKQYPLRGGFQYQNIMYVIAGELIESVSGQHWTQFVNSNILDPLAMTRTQTLSVDIKEAGNYVTPHNNDIDDGVIKVGYTFSDQVGAAGMIWSSINDISKYLIFLVNDGVNKSEAILKPATFQYLFKPHSILTEASVYPTNALTKPKWNTYGLGWFQQDYRGSKLDFHTGSLPGLVAIAGIMHDHDMAVYVFANLDHAELRHAIMYKAIDLFAFNDNKRHWHQEVYELYSGFKENALASLKERNEERVLDTKTSLSLDQYKGTYQNKMLGEVSVNSDDGQLQININNYLSYTTTHWHYNTFITNIDPKFRKELMLHFTLNQSGKIADLEIFGEKFIKTEE
jgi:CubicO group peptidase (beta-lactamase class C family)